MKKFIAFIFCGITFACIANAEELYWFSDGTLANRSSCEPGGDITTPNGPYKYGYRFIEWAPMTVYDITTLDTTENSTNYSYSNNTSTPVRTRFSYGTVLSMPLCSNTTNTNFITNPHNLNTRADSGGYCYCRIIGFIPDGETNVYAPVSSSWQYRNTYYYNMLDRCIGACPQDCAKTLGSTQTFRAALYGASGN